MKIKVINPNTTLSMTEKIAAAARAAAASETEIVAVSPAHGPVSIECHHDEAAAALGVVDEVRQGEEDGMDAYVVACFGDPGLHASREIAAGPVLGIAEAAMHAASFVSTGFSVITTLSRSCVIARRLARDYGMEPFCRGIRAANMPVLDLERPDSGAYQAVLREARTALDEDGCAAIILGCAGMADLCAKLTGALGVPVIDGVAAAVKMAEALVGIGLRTSKRGDYAPPPAKRYVGLTSRFSLP